MTSRRDFMPPEDDRVFLDGFGLHWDAIMQGAVRAVVIRGYPIPAGYNVTTADVQLRLDAGYPDTQIDMVYFSPPIQRADGKAIAATNIEPFDGTQWQRWSRHRTAVNPWVAGQDNIERHLMLVDDWLQRELKK